MKVGVVTLMAVITLGSLLYAGLTFRDTIARGDGTRRDTLIGRQRFGVVAALGVPVLLGTAWILDIPLTAMWWLFALAVIQIGLAISATIEIRRGNGP